MAILASRGLRRFPDADTSGGSVDELTRNTPEAVKQVYASSEQFIPEPTCDTLEFHPFDMDDSEGIRVVFGINLPRVSRKPYAFNSARLKAFCSKSMRWQRASNAALRILRRGCRA
jgi:hypothetical protein